MWIAKLARWVPCLGQAQAQTDRMDRRIRMERQRAKAAEVAAALMAESRIANATTTARATIRLAKVEDMRKGGTDAETY